MLYVYFGGLYVAIFLLLEDIIKKSIKKISNKLNIDLNSNLSLLLFAIMNESNGYKQFEFSFKNNINRRAKYIISIIFIASITISWIYLQSINAVSEFACFQFLK